MIPQEKTEAVARALDEAFGVTQFEDIRLIKDVASSLVFRIVVRGSPFLLKISTRTSDPARHYSCMKAAAQAGVAPRVWYTSVDDRISIEDFVETAPFPLPDALIRIPATLRKLHALLPFPAAPDHINTSCTFLLNKSPALDAFLRKFAAAGILPEAQSDEVSSLYAQIAAVYSRCDADMVSSHNDLFKPDNMLFDGARLWLIDWEAAFLNDRYADLAVTANLVVASDADESLFLQQYFEPAPDEYQRARFFLMQQIAHAFYAMAFLFLGSRSQPIDWSQTVPEYSDFHQRFWTREIDLACPASKITCGRVHLERLFRNAREPRFNESLRIVADRRANTPENKQILAFPPPSDP